MPPILFPNEPAPFCRVSSGEGLKAAGIWRKPFAGFPISLADADAANRNQRKLAGFYGLCKINLMQVAIQKFFGLMPLFFGIGFIAPLVAQSLVALGISAPFGLGPAAFGLLVGAPWGLYATWRGRWL